MKVGSTPWITTATLGLVGTIAVETAAAPMGGWSKLLKHAVPTANSRLDHRLLEETPPDGPDFQNYAVRFEKCHEVSEAEYLRAFGQEDEAEIPTAVARSSQTTNLPSHLNMRRFVVFRLCPVSPDLPPSVCSDSCEDSAFGEYMLDIVDYLDATAAFQQVVQEDKCNHCYERCNREENYFPLGNVNVEEEEDSFGVSGGDDDNFGVNGEEEGIHDAYAGDDPTCSDCLNECELIDSMEVNGYLDATLFTKCQMIYEGGQTIGSLQTSRYAGPTCASGGTKIKIGLFRDEDCHFLDDKTGLSVEDFLVNEEGWFMKLSHATLKKTYSPDECMPCEFPLTSSNWSHDVCFQLYEPAQKCERSGAAAGRQDPVCDFLASLEKGGNGVATSAPTIDNTAYDDDGWEHHYISNDDDTPIDTTGYDDSLADDEGTADKDSTVIEYEKPCRLDVYGVYGHQFSEETIFTFLYEVQTLPSITARDLDYWLLPKLEYVMGKELLPRIFGSLCQGLPVFGSVVGLNIQPADRVVSGWVNNACEPDAPDAECFLVQGALTVMSHPSRPTPEVVEQVKAAIELTLNTLVTTEKHLVSQTFVGHNPTLDSETFVVDTLPTVPPVSYPTTYVDSTLVSSSSSCLRPSLWLAALGAALGMLGMAW